MRIILLYKLVTISIRDEMLLNFVVGADDTFIRISMTKYILRRNELMHVILFLRLYNKYINLYIILLRIEFIIKNGIQIDLFTWNGTLTKEFFQDTHRGWVEDGQELTHQNDS